MFKSVIFLSSLLFVSAVYSRRLREEFSERSERSQRQLSRIRDKTYNVLAMHAASIEELQLEAVEALTRDLTEFDEQYQGLNDLQRMAYSEIESLLVMAKDGNITECTKPIEDLSDNLDAIMEKMRLCAHAKTRDAQFLMQGIDRMSQVTLETIDEIAQHVPMCSENVTTAEAKACFQTIAVGVTNVSRNAVEQINLSMNELKVVWEASQDPLEGCSLNATEIEVLNGWEDIFHTAETCAKNEATTKEAINVVETSTSSSECTDNDNGCETKIVDTQTISPSLKENN